MRAIHPTAKLPRSTLRESSSTLPLLTASFVLGAFLGCVLAASVSGAGSMALDTYMSGFTAALREGSVQAPSLMAASWAVLRWPLAVLLLGYVSFGLIGIPLLVCARGFFFTFCIAAFVQTLGGKGLLFALLLLGVESFLSIPVLFVLASQSLGNAALRKEAKGKSRPTKTEQSPVLLLRNTVCFCILLFCILWELLLLPLLLSGANRFFTT